MGVGSSTMPLFAAQLLRWFLKPFLLYFFSHKSHATSVPSSPPRHTFLWFLRLASWLNSLSHLSQIKFFFSFDISCILFRWMVNPPLDRQIFLHISHSWTKDILSSFVAFSPPPSPLSIDGLGCFPSSECVSSAFSPSPSTFYDLTSID